MTGSPEGDRKKVSQSLPVLVFSTVLIAVILVNAYMIWYFLIGMPSVCASRVAASAGRETCTGGMAVPFIVVLSAALVAASVLLLYRWHIRKKEP